MNYEETILQSGITHPKSTVSQTDVNFEWRAGGLSTKMYKGNGE